MNISGAHIMMQRSYLHESCHLGNPIIVTRDNWLVDVTDNRVVGKMPSIVLPNKVVASKTSIAFRALGREHLMFILQIPPTLLTSPGTWDWSGDDHDDQKDNGYSCMDIDGTEE